MEGPGEHVVDSAGMPTFGLDGYSALLDRFAAQGYETRGIGAMDESDEPARVLYLRHDLDLMVASALPMAAIEAARGMRATYYVLLTGPYNACAPEQRAALRELAAGGHDIGLHYDLGADDAGPGEWRAELDRALVMLEAIVGTPVRTISTHNPSLGGDDPFRDLQGLRHPHDPRDRRELLYVSDSRRRWRDTSLLRCFGEDAPSRVMLLTHPELWLDPVVVDAEEYLRERVSVQALAPMRSYLEEEVPRLWRAVEPQAPSREERRTPQCRIVRLDRATAERRLTAIGDRFAQFEEIHWTAEQILADREGKWDLSLLALAGDDVAGFSIDSLRGGHLYVHALFVGPEHRRGGLGRRMIEHLTATAARNRLAGVALRVAFANVGAIRFYLSCGFAIVDAEPEERQLVLVLPTSTPEVIA